MNPEVVLPKPRAVFEMHGDVPGGNNQKGNGEDQTNFSGAKHLPKGHIEQYRKSNARRYKRGRRTLGHDRERRGGQNQIPPAAIAIFKAEIGINGKEGEESEENVGGAKTGTEEEFRSRDKNHTRKNSHSRSVKPSANYASQARKNNSGESRNNSGTELIDSEHAIKSRGSPHQERGIFEPPLVPPMKREPISRLHDFLGNLRVDGLVPVLQACFAQARQYEGGCQQANEKHWPLP